MQKTIERQVLNGFGEQLELIGLALLKGNIAVEHIEQDMTFHGTNTRIEMFVHGHKLNINFQSRKGL